MSRKIILDVDTGMDDAIAIAVAAFSSELEVLGITVTHGNLSLINTLENTLRVVEFLGKDIPVYAGCPEPMVQRLLPGRHSNVRRQTTNKILDGVEINIHEQLLDLPSASIKHQEKHACSYIIDTLKNSDEKITLVLVGPLTNIGMALRMDPSITENIEEMVIMGGAIKCGNRTPVAEANFYDDPEAAQIVLQSGCKIRIVTLDATETVRINYSDSERFRDASPVGVWIADIIKSFIRNCTLLEIIKDGYVAIHDAVTVCSVIDPSVITVIRHSTCDIDINGGASDGQLVVDNRGFYEPIAQTYVAYECDRDKCLNIMINALS